VASRLHVLHADTETHINGEINDSEIKTPLAVICVHNACIDSFSCRFVFETRGSKSRHSGAVARGTLPDQDGSCIACRGNHRQRVAVAGLGLMGGWFARHLLAAGYSVLAHDVDRAKVDALV
jgi:hypothetical protein